MKKLVLLIALACNVSAQSDKPLTNQDVIEMANAALPASVIVSKIKASKVAFKTDIADLKMLADAKVPESVISAMLEKQSERPVVEKQVEYGSENAEYGSLSEIRGRSKVFLVVEDSEARKVIVNALAKDSTIMLVNDRKDADFGIRFFIGRVDKGSNIILGTAHNVAVVGELWVYTYLPLRPGDEKGRVRVLWQKRKQQDWSGGFTFDRHPARQVVNDFLKELKKVS